MAAAEGNKSCRQTKVERNVVHTDGFSLATEVACFLGENTRENRKSLLVGDPVTSDFLEKSWVLS